MAENINVPYAEIVKAAIIPAILYFASAFWMVHLEAGKRGLVCIPRAELPSPIAAIKRQWHLALPLLVLIYLLMDGYTPLFAGSMGLALTVVMILGGAVALNLQGTALRAVLWIVIGLIAATFVKFGVNVLLWLIAALVLVSAFSRGGRETVLICRDVLAEGARQALPVGLACAIVGTVIGTLTLTGTATIFGNWIVSFGRESLFLCLVLVMVTSLVLGTGLPTIPTYIITASLAAPALLQLGVPLIISHMFVFYYGIIADLTPPVALAALAAAPIAKASPDAIGWQATRIALAGFLIPFMGVYEPTLMMQAGGQIAADYGYWVEVVWACLKASLTILVCGVAAIGYFHTHTSRTQQMLAALSGLLFILPGAATDIAAIAVAALMVVWNHMDARRAQA
jgi:TRAP transporter 4TM/12TM fusion protein